MESTRFISLASMIKYTCKTIDMMDWLLIIRINYKNSYFDNYQENYFCQATKIFSDQIFRFSIYKIVDSEYSTSDCKSTKISIEPQMKNPEMLKFIPVYLET